MIQIRCYRRLQMKVEMPSLPLVANEISSNATVAVDGI